MLDDFLNYNLYIVLRKEDIGGLQELKEILGNIKYSSGHAIDSFITKSVLEKNNEIGLCCKNNKIMYSTETYKKRSKVSLQKFLDSIVKYNIEENEIAEMFV